MGCFVVLWCGPKRGFENRHRVGAAVVVLPALVRCFGEVLRSRAPRDAERRTGCAHTLQGCPSASRPPKAAPVGL